LKVSFCSGFVPGAILVFSHMYKCTHNVGNLNTPTIYGLHLKVCYSSYTQPSVIELHRTDFASTTAAVVG